MLKQNIIYMFYRWVPKGLKGNDNVLNIQNTNNIRMYHIGNIL